MVPFPNPTGTHAKAELTALSNLRRVEAVCFRRSPATGSQPEMNLDTGCDVEDIAKDSVMCFYRRQHEGRTHCLGEAVVFTKRMLPDSLLP